MQQLQEIEQALFCIPNDQSLLLSQSITTLPASATKSAGSAVSQICCSSRANLLIFCTVHTEKSSHVATEDEMKRGLKLLKEAGMKKINFAGGEPFLYPKQLAMLCKYCKVDLGLESVSIISNGTKIKEDWLQQHGKYVDVLGVSCDSFHEATNIKIGRGTGKNVTQLFLIRDWCRSLGIKFKLNTVVCNFNWQEDMASTVEQLDPFRCKCFQVLEVQDENDSSTVDTELDKRKRNAKRFTISDGHFQHFCNRHEHLLVFVPESNALMVSSYLILDEYLCFLDKGSGKEKQSSCILDVGVAKALEEVYWDEAAFVQRGGVYDWSKDLGENDGCGSVDEVALEW
jgi:radical S-adenosyl methionine domain-containing protein 2